MRIKFLVNERAISLNSMYGRQGFKSFLKSDAQLLQDRIGEAIEDQCGDVHFKGEVSVKIKVEKNTGNHWDIDNQAKCIIDAIVKHGVIIDDDLIYELYLVKGKSKRDTIQVVVEDLKNEFY